MCNEGESVSYHLPHLRHIARKVKGVEGYYQCYLPVVFFKLYVLTLSFVRLLQWSKLLSRDKQFSNPKFSLKIMLSSRFLFFIYLIFPWLKEKTLLHDFLICFFLSIHLYLYFKNLVVYVEVIHTKMISLVIYFICLFISKVRENYLDVQLW